MRSMTYLFGTTTDMHFLVLRKKYDRRLTNKKNRVWVFANKLDLKG